MPYQTLELTTINIRKLSPVKVSLTKFAGQDHSRWILAGAPRSGSNRSYYKIWNPTYVRRDNILAAIDSGFYDELTVPALQAIIVHKGCCRGYVMAEGEQRFEGADGQFEELIYSRTRDTGLFLAQYRRQHTVRYENAFSLIDLEGVYEIDDLPLLPALNSRIEDDKYREFVCGLFRQSAADAGLPSDSAISSQLPPRRPNPGQLHTRLMRRIARSARRLVPRTDLIEY